MTSAGTRVVRLGAIAAILAAHAGGFAQERTMEVTATAYNSVRAQTDANPNEGAWGDEIRPGMKIIAVSPDLLEAGLDRGTEVRFEGLPGTWTVLDRTPSRFRKRIDVYMGTDIEAALEWGIRKVTIRWSD